MNTGVTVNTGERDELAPAPIEHMICVAMPSMERKKKLEQCFTFLKINGVGLSEFQESKLRLAMEVGKYEAVPE